MIVKVNTEAVQGTEPFTRSNIWLSKVTSGENGDGIRGILVYRMYEDWTNKTKKKNISLKKVNYSFFFHSQTKLTN